MDCPFCSQWNPPGALRCCFCNNKLDAAQDETIAGRPGYMGAPLPTALPSGGASRRPPARFPRQVKAGGITLQLTPGQWVGVGVFLLFLITTLSSRCS